jgi:hypothetical protein
VAAGVGDRLEDDAVDGRVGDAQADDLPHLVLVDPLLDGRDERDGQSFSFAGRERPLLVVAQVPPADGQVRLTLEPVELEIDVSARAGALGGETRIPP